MRGRSVASQGKVLLTNRVPIEEPQPTVKVDIPKVKIQREEAPQQDFGESAEDRPWKRNNGKFNDNRRPREDRSENFSEGFRPRRNFDDRRGEDQGGRPPRFRPDFENRDRGFSRDDRPSRFGGDFNSDKPRFNRENRGDNFDRPRYNKSENFDKPRFNRDDNFNRPRFNREDRPSRFGGEGFESSRFNRGERPNRYNNEESDNRGFNNNRFRDDRNRRSNSFDESDKPSDQFRRNRFNGSRDGDILGEGQFRSKFGNTNRDRSERTEPFGNSNRGDFGRPRDGPKGNNRPNTMSKIDESAEEALGIHEETFEEQITISKASGLGNIPSTLSSEVNARREAPGQTTTFELKDR